MVRTVAVCGFVWCLLLSPVRSQDLRTAAFMQAAEKGFAQIYNLDYDQAHKTFSDLRRVYPEHPAPPLYLATVAWLTELFGRNELDLDRFIAPAYFTQPTTRKMPAEARKYFLDNIQTSQQLAEAILKKDPKNQDARYFVGAAHGVLGAFSITIDRSYSDAFSHGKKAYKQHHAIIQENPDYFDAYMSVGLYEYIVDNLPWYIKWVAVIIGYRGSQERGFECLGRAASKGQYSADDAAVLQMVLFVRENRFADAFKNVSSLHSRYPRNYILHLNRAQILERLGRRTEAAGEYREILARVDARAPNYGKIPMPGFRLDAARKLLGLGDAGGALSHFEKLLAGDPGEREKALSHLGAGRALDLLGRRKEATTHYEAVLRLRDFDDSHDRARDHLKRPYSR